MIRREFLKFSATGLTVVAVGSMTDWPLFWRGSNAHAADHLSLDRLELEMVAVDAEMVDGVPVPMWAFRIDDDDVDIEEDPHDITAPRIPGPAMVALAGDRIRLNITNNIATGGTHGFAVPGVVEPVTIPLGSEVEIEFTAPAPGTYLYQDPFNDPINRMMGLHGVLVVLPNPIGNNTPYLNPTPNIQALFDALGTTFHLPGRPWDSTRNVIWVMNVIDSGRFAQVANNQGAVSPAFFSRADGFLPDYFTLNGKSGFFSAQHEHDAGHDASETAILDLSTGIYDLQANISFRGTVGQPILIRSVNVGTMWHSPHIHGTHVYSLSQANIHDGSRALNNNLTFVDTWTLPPGAIQDHLHPFNVPPDVPNWEEVVDADSDERFPFVYPMHDHNEISNTAAGGNYPHGIATHWQFDNSFDVDDPATGVIFIDRAELRVRTGQLFIDGRFSVANQRLRIHAGGASGAELTRMIQVGSEEAPNGGFRFRYRGRALKALGSRVITLMHHNNSDDNGNGHTIHAVRTVPLTRR